MGEDRVDSVLIKKAVKALFTYEAKKSEGSMSLVGNYAKPVLAQIQLVKAVGEPVLRPVRVKIPHSMYSPSVEDHTVCMFCRSEDKEELEEYLQTHPVEGLTTIISLNEVKKKYARLQEKKKLLGEHTHFICDTRVMNQLYNLLGKVFSSRNNYPVPVDFKSIAKLEAAVRKSVDSTYMHLKGSNISIRFGYNSMSPGDVTTNIVAGLDFAVTKLKNEWKNVHSIHIKTSDSEALPVYSKVPSDELKHVQSLAGTDKKAATGKKSAAAAAKKAAAAKAAGKAAMATKGKVTKKEKMAVEEVEEEEEEEEEEEAPRPKRGSAKTAASKTGAKPASKKAVPAKASTKDVEAAKKAIRTAAAAAKKTTSSKKVSKK